MTFYQNSWLVVYGMCVRWDFGWQRVLFKVEVICPCLIGDCCDYKAFRLETDRAPDMPTDISCNKMVGSIIIRQIQGSVYSVYPHLARLYL